MWICLCMTHATVTWPVLQASPGEMEAELANGLIIGHAYSITSVKMVRTHLMSVSQTPSGSLSFGTHDFLWFCVHLLQHTCFISNSSIHPFLSPLPNPDHLESLEGCGEMDCSFPSSSQQSPPVPFSTMFSHSWLFIVILYQQIHSILSILIEIFVFTESMWPS